LNIFPKSHDEQKTAAAPSYWPSAVPEAGSGSYSSTARSYTADANLSPAPFEALGDSGRGPTPPGGTVAI
ncbi:MAG: hypothetical protein KBD01_18835, partial [Acidobacteria bacterium]|nr:hypothetical protein [Acidobacteriota bacterium]